MAFLGFKSNVGALAPYGIMGADATGRLNAYMLGDGSISNTELSSLDGITGNIQSQLNAISGGRVNYPATVSAVGDVVVSAPASDVFDGVTIFAGSTLVFLSQQADPAENGLWVFNGVGVAMTRPVNFVYAIGVDVTYNSWEDVYGSQVAVSLGTQFAGSLFFNVNNQSGTFGTTSIIYTEAAGNYQGSSSITLTGNIFSITTSFFTDEATVASNGAVTLTNSAVISKVLTGLVTTNLALVLPTDSILVAMSKIASMEKAKLAQQVVAVSTALTASQLNTVVTADATITLPAAASVIPGLGFTITAQGGVNVTVAPNGAENLNGANVALVYSGIQGVTFISDGTQWGTQDYALTIA